MIKIGILDLSGIKYSLDRKEKQSAQSKFARLLLKELYKDFSDKIYKISKLGEIQALDDFEVCVIDLTNGYLLIS